MTTAYEKCPYCTAEFHGDPSPRCAAENAILQVGNHIWTRHPEQLFQCGRGRSTVAKDYWRENNTCSYCGGMSPEALFANIEAGVEAVPTDKNYKIYVGQWKFYFQHLDEPGMLKFIDLYNNGKINMPDRFYVMPFFMKAKNAT